MSWEEVQVSAKPEAGGGHGECVGCKKFNRVAKVGVGEVGRTRFSTTRLPRALYSLLMRSNLILGCLGGSVG